MPNEIHLHSLRIKVIELSMQYTKGMREGKSMEELKSLREEIHSLEAEIDALEQNLKK